MKPALSVLLFTVLSGVGVGALALLALADLAARAGLAQGSATPMMPAIAAVAIALVVVGLCASTLHLANPRNAWRSLVRWRSSWLSREALCAIAFIPVAIAFALLRAREGPALALDVLVVALAWAMLYCTAMIYASLKPIRQWYTRRVPLTFALLAHASGALLIVCGMSVGNSIPTAWAVAGVALFVVAFVAKLEYWRFVARGDTSITLEQALGVAHGVGPPRRSEVEGRTIAARLLDAGHTKGTFLTREFVHHPGRAMTRTLRAIAIVAGFVVPLLWLVIGFDDWRVGVAVFVGCIGGLLAERWLFFAEARHTVRLYHGEART